MLKTLFISALLAALTLAPQGGVADVYKCVNSDGGVSFQDQPCGAGDEQTAVEIDSTEQRIEPELDRAVEVQESGRFESADPQKEPFSVPLSSLEDRINTDPSAEGVKMHIGHGNGILSFDIYETPGDTSAAAVLRVLFMAFRLAEKDYSKVNLTDSGSVIFSLVGQAAQSIGQQFVWGEAGAGQNPIALIRQFADALVDQNGNRVAPPFNGHLLGDTTRALDTVNKRLHPDWTFATIDIK
jgi:hypothetical protein